MTGLDRTTSHPHVTDTTRDGWATTPIAQLICATCGLVPDDPIHWSTTSEQDAHNRERT